MSLTLAASLVALVLWVVFSLASFAFAPTVA